MAYLVYKYIKNPLYICIAMHPYRRLYRLTANTVPTTLAVAERKSIFINN